MDYLDCRSTLEKEKEMSKSSFQGMGTLAHSGFPLIVAKTTLFIIGPFYVISMSFVNYFFSRSVDTNKKNRVISRVIVLVERKE